MAKHTEIYERGAQCISKAHEVGKRIVKAARNSKVFLQERHGFLLGADESHLPVDIEDRLDRSKFPIIVDATSRSLLPFGFLFLRGRRGLQDGNVVDDLFSDELRLV